MCPPLSSSKKLQIGGSRGSVRLGFAAYPRWIGGHSLNHTDAPKNLGHRADGVRASGQATKGITPAEPQ